MHSLNNPEITAGSYIFDSVGCLIIQGAVDPAPLAKLNAILDSRIVSPGAAKFSVMELDDMFMELMTHPLLVTVCKEVLGDQFRFDHAFGLEHPPARPNLHGGPLACQGSCFYQGRSLGQSACSMGRLSAGFALTAQSPSTGGFAYIPGSHRSSYAIHGSVVLRDLFNSDLQHQAIHIPTLRPGDLCVFPDCLVHGTTVWHARYTRRVLYYMFSPGYMAWRPYSEIEHYVKLARTPLQRQLLRPPYVAEFTDRDGVVGDNHWRTATTAV